MEGNYRWSKGARRPKGITADQAAVEFERIRQTAGELTAEALLAESEPPNAVLHQAFVWDNERAAHQHRLQQARQLIRAVVTVKSDGVPEHRSYVLVKTGAADEQTSYMPAVEVVTRTDLLGDALSRLRAELSSARDSVNEVVSLADALNAASERRERLRAVGNRVNEAVLAAEAV